MAAKLGFRSADAALAPTSEAAAAIGDARRQPAWKTGRRTVRMARSRRVNLRAPRSFYAVGFSNRKPKPRTVAMNWLPPDASAKRCRTRLTRRSMLLSGISPASSGHT